MASSANQNNSQKRIKLDEKSKSLEHKNKIQNTSNQSEMSFTKSYNTKSNTSIFENTQHISTNKKISLPSTLVSDSQNLKSENTKFDQKNFFTDPEFQRILPNNFFSNPNHFSQTNQLFLNTQQSLLNNFNFKSAFTSPSSLRQPELSSKPNRRTKRDNTDERKLCNALNIENLVNNDASTKAGVSNSRVQSSQHSDMGSELLNSNLATLYQQIQTLQSNPFYQFNNAQKQLNSYQNYFHE